MSTFTLPEREDTAMDDDPVHGENLALSASVIDVSSEFSDAWAGSNAIDDDLGTEWATAGDGDLGFLAIDLGSAEEVVGVEFLTPSMADGSAIANDFFIVVDDGDRMGPFAAGNPADPGFVPLTFIGTVIRFEIDTSTGETPGPSRSAYSHRPQGPAMARTARLRARRRDEVVGWLFVGVQALLLVALILTPDGDLWPVTGPVGTIGGALNVAGFGLIGWAVITFGAGVTPSPVPSARASLVSSGPFRWIRHPMYTGVMAIGVGITLRTATWTALALLAALVVFFNVKACWEERRLADAYEGYASYRKGAGRFLPRYGRNVAL